MDGQNGEMGPRMGMRKKRTFAALKCIPYAISSEREFGDGNGGIAARMDSIWFWQ
jgi:hypothetical protein